LSRQHFQAICTLLGGALLLAGLAGCSDIGSVNLLPRLDTFTRPASLSYSAVGNDLSLPPVGPNDLVNQDGQCSGAAPAAGPPVDASPDGTAAFVQAPVALQMSECDVVKRLGSPDRTNIGANERRERSVVLTYNHGARPAIYTFAAGRLVSIEGEPGAPAAAKPQKPAKAAKKKAPAT
jgi:hypothetical protein